MDLNIYSVKDVLETIDTSKMEKGYIKELAEELDIYTDPYELEGEERLTYCYYYSWICTDTRVGIRVWYFDEKPICISWKLYRKSSEYFYWINKGDALIVKNYIRSLEEIKVFSEDLITDEGITNMIKEAREVNYKRFEKFNIIK